MNPLTLHDIRLLKWCVNEAETWRGTMVGNPDPAPLAAFDARIATARAAIRKVQALRTAARKVKP